MPKIMHGKQKRKILKREMALALRENCNSTKKKERKITEDDLLNMIAQTENA